jgi:anaerobic selenocysteine-containing dehydrogenase
VISLSRKKSLKITGAAAGIAATSRALVGESLYDREYVRKYGFGFEQPATSISQFTPGRAYPETGIDPEQIRNTAREMAPYRPRLFTNVNDLPFYHRIVATGNQEQRP